MDTLNPFQSPRTSDTKPNRSLSGYSVIAVPRGWHGFSQSKKLLELIQKHAALGDCVVASCSESHDRRYIVFRSTDGSEMRKRQYSYSLVRSPKAKSLSKTKSGKLTEFMASHFPSLDAGWIPVAPISNDQIILTKVEELPPEHRYDEFLVAHLPPVWWRTLFGFSYMRIIGEEINKIAANGNDVITYLGDDRYLLGKRKPLGEAANFDYQLILSGNILSALLIGFASSCQKRLDRMSAQGWELVTCHSSHFLFRRVRPL